MGHALESDEVRGWALRIRKSRPSLHGRGLYRSVLLTWEAVELREGDAFPKLPSSSVRG